MTLFSAYYFGQGQKRNLEFHLKAKISFVTMPTCIILDCVNSYVMKICTCIREIRNNVNVIGAKNKTDVLIYDLLASGIHSRDWGITGWQSCPPLLFSCWSTNKYVAYVDRRYIVSSSDIRIHFYFINFFFSIFFLFRIFSCLSSL